MFQTLTKLKGNSRLQVTNLNGDNFNNLSLHHDRKQNWKSGVKSSLVLFYCLRKLKVS